MAGFFQPFLRGALDGFADAPYLRDYQHGSKIFTPNNYGNAPKFKWLFHVYFDINKYLLTNTNIEKIFPSTTNYGLLVKSIDLPKYNIALTEMNQYNRKRYVQTKINYDPIRVVFHDDNANQIRQLWFNYFSYYYNDPNQPDNFTRNAKAGEASRQLNPRNAYENDITTSQNWGYIGEIPQYTVTNSNGEFLGKSKAPFFNSIRIYGFNQHNWALYEVINPVIETFSHDNYNYYQTRDTMENQMTIRYETVKYYDGALDGKKPYEIVDGFGNTNEYDTTLSPLNTPGTNRSITGQGGLVDAIGGITEDLANGNIFGALQTAARTGRTFKNTKQVVAAAKSELISGVVGAIPSVVNRTFNFPGAGATSGAGQQNVNRTNALNTEPAPVVTATPIDAAVIRRNIPPGGP